MKIIACGDIALCRSVGEKILEGNGDEIAKGLREELCKADIFLANIECPLTDSKKPAWEYFPTLKGPRNGSKVLKKLGVDVASIANNHIADYGLRGFEDTISTLEEHEIKWCGAGKTPEEATRPLIIEKNNIRTAILALAQPEISAAKNGRWGAGILTDREAIETVKNLKKDNDIIIAYLHFGVEFFNYPTPHQVRLSRSLIDAGANLVIGHHPHVPQGYEYYNNGFIAYSLGNFIFDMKPGSHQFSRMGLLIKADVDAKGINKVNVIPVDTTGGNPKYYKDEEKELASIYLNQLSHILHDKTKIYNIYYFTCRDNLLIHIRALIYFIFKGAKRNIYDWIWQQFWPQLFELRRDLFYFIISGNALKYEKKKGLPSEGFIAYIWRAVCYVGWWAGLGWGKFIKIENQNE